MREQATRSCGLCSSSAGWPGRPLGCLLEERLKRISEALRGRRYGARPRVRRLVLERIREMLEARGAAGEAAAAVAEPEV